MNLWQQDDGWQTLSVPAMQILERTSRRYDDQTGPVLLVMLLIAATVTALALTAAATSF